jgi:hypothetical protein
MYILLDANVTAAYYLPRCLKSKRATDRITNIFDSVRSGGSDHFFYIPNFCIAEVFSTFMKYAFGEWNPALRARGTIDARVYESLVEQFEGDIHNGRFLYQYELSRYHILATNLVGPIDHYFKIRRGRRKSIIPMGTFDHLIVAMGVHLAHIHGSQNVVILSADERLTDVLSKCKSPIPARTIHRLKLEIAEKVTGRPFSPDLFPRHLNLKSATVAQLREVFDPWPLPVLSQVRAYRWLR